MTFPTCCSHICYSGAGFAGFWYHLGLFQGLGHELGYSDYFCYSSGCLSLVLAFLNTTVDETFDACNDIQNNWVSGDTSRYDLVVHFVDRLVTDQHVARIQSLLHRLNIIVTTTSQGVKISQPSNREELVDLLIKTTWIPLITGRGVLEQDGERFLDGGFSRKLHPTCDHTVVVPTTWTTLWNTLNPGFGRETVYKLFDMGRTAESALAPKPVRSTSRIR
jgi:hypothetical protein